MAEYDITDTCEDEPDWFIGYVHFCELVFWGTLCYGLAKLFWF